MVELCEVKDFRWSVAKGLRLKELRGKVSRRAVSEGVIKSGLSLSERHLQRIEENDVAGVSQELLSAILAQIELDIGAIVLTSKTILQAPPERI